MLTVAFDIIKLWELPAEPILNSTNYDLWPLASIMSGASLEQSLAIAERIASAPLTHAERSELTGLLVVVSELRLRRREVLQVLRRNPMIDELVRQSSLFEEAMEEGKREGKQEGERATLQIVLEGRFGTLYPALLAAIASADEATLHAVARRAATDSLDALRTLLTTAQTTTQKSSQGNTDPSTQEPNP